MRFNLTAAVGIAAGSIGLIAGVLIPKPPQTYGMAVVTGTTKADPAMKDYVEKVKTLQDEKTEIQNLYDYQIKINDQLNDKLDDADKQSKS